jgi:hypothetical protein
MLKMTELRSKVPTVAIHTDLVGHFVVWYVGTCLSLLGRGGKAFCVTAPRDQVKGYMAISVSERHTACVFRTHD